MMLLDCRLGVGLAHFSDKINLNLIDLTNLAYILHLGRNSLLSLPIPLLLGWLDSMVCFVGTEGLSRLVELALLNPYHFRVGDRV